MNVRRQMAQGAFWAFVEKGGNQVASFLVFIFLARLVGPGEYGLISLCYVYTGLVTTLFFYIPDGLISLKIHDAHGQSTLFWSCVIIGALFSLLGVAISYPMAWVFNQPRLAELMMWFSIVPLLLGLAAFPAAYFSSKMNYRVPAIRTIIASLVGGGIGLFMAYKGSGAMALVWQQIIFYLAANIVLWTTCDWKPQWRFNLPLMRKILWPGLKAAGVNSLSFAQDQLPRVFLGLFLTPVDIGYYALATRVGSALREIIFAPLGTVVFPALSLIKGNLDDQTKILSELFMIMGLLVLPIVALACLTVPLYVPLFFGEKWRAAAPALQIFMLSVVASPFITLIQSIFRAHNAMGSFFKIHALQVGVSLLVCYLAVPYGVTVMTGVLASFFLLALPLYSFVLERRLNIDLWNNYIALTPILFSTMLMIAGVAVLGEMPFVPKDGWGGLAIRVLAGIAFYVASIFFLWRDKIGILTAEAKKIMMHRKK